MADGATAARVTDELGEQGDLGRPEHHRRAELEDEDARVEGGQRGGGADCASGRLPAELDVRALREQHRGELVGERLAIGERVLGGRRRRAPLLRDGEQAGEGALEFAAEDERLGDELGARDRQQQGGQVVQHARDLGVAEQRVEHLDLRLGVRAHHESAEHLEAGRQLTAGEEGERARATPRIRRARAALDDQRLHVRQHGLARLHVLLVQRLERATQPADGPLAALQLRAARHRTRATSTVILKAL